MLDAEDGSRAAPEIRDKWVFKEHHQKRIGFVIMQKNENYKPLAQVEGMSLVFIIATFSFGPT